MVRTAVTLVEVTVTQNHRCNDCPRVDDDARPAGGDLDPHCRLIHRQVQA